MDRQQVITSASGKTIDRTVDNSVAGARHPDRDHSPSQRPDGHAERILQSDSFASSGDSAEQLGRLRGGEFPRAFPRLKVAPEPAASDIRGARQFGGETRGLPWDAGSNCRTGLASDRHCAAAPSDHFEASASSSAMLNGRTPAPPKLPQSLFHRRGLKQRAPSSGHADAPPTSRGAVRTNLHDGSVKVIAR